MVESRTKNAALNVFWTIINQLLMTILSLLSRKFFLSEIGAELLGLSSLFADILIIFSFADLGIGTAISFCLYKPIANNDTEKIQEYLLFLKKFYRIVVAALIIVGACFIPMLLLLNTELPFLSLLSYYGMYLLSNIVSYLWVYKETYVTAIQQERKIAIFNSVFSIVQISVQILLVKLFGNFYIYLTVSIVTTILKKIVLNCYINDKYPIVKLSENIRRLDKEDKKELFNKSKSMMVHKFGNLAINQTDSLIISSMISVTLMGFVSNYLVIKNTINNVVSKIYTSVLPSMGNLVAKESENVQIRIFFIYDFLNFWLTSFCFVAMAVLSTPFITLFFGKGYEIDKTTIILLFGAFLIDGLRSPVSLLREATGEYEKDKWFTIVAAVVNLVVSIVCVIFIGLPGIYIGTICAMAILIVSRTYLLSKTRFNELSFPKYMIRVLLYLVVSFSIYFLTSFLCGLVDGYIDSPFLVFLIDIAIVIVVSNILLFLLTFYTTDFKNTFTFIHNRIRLKRSKTNG